MNKRIKNGTSLTETLEDLFQEIYSHKVFIPPQEDINFQESSPSLALEKMRHIIDETLSFVLINVDEVIRGYQLQASDVWSVLLEMEIQDVLSAIQVARCPLKKTGKANERCHC